MGSAFHGAIDAHVAIPAPHCGPGGTMNFNIGGTSMTDGTLALLPTRAQLTESRAKAESRALFDRPIRQRPRLCRSPRYPCLDP